MERPDAHGIGSPRVRAAYTLPPATAAVATVALAVGTVFLVNMGKARFWPVTVVPMVFVAVTTLTAGFLSIKNTYLPLALKPGMAVQGYLDAGLTAVFMVAVVVILADSGRRCVATLRGKPLPPKAFGPARVVEGVAQRCC